HSQQIRPLQHAGGLGREECGSARVRDGDGGRQESADVLVSRLSQICRGPGRERGILSMHRREIEGGGSMKSKRWVVLAAVVLACAGTLDLVHPQPPAKGDAAAAGYGGAGKV